MLLYIGPGIGASTILIVFMVLIIVIVSFLVVLYRPILRIINKFRKKSSDDK